MVGIGFGAHDRAPPARPGQPVPDSNLRRCQTVQRRNTRSDRYRLHDCPTTSEGRFAPWPATSYRVPSPVCATFLLSSFTFSIALVYSIAGFTPYIRIWYTDRDSLSAPFHPDPLEQFRWFRAVEKAHLSPNAMTPATSARAGGRPSVFMVLLMSGRRAVSFSFPITKAARTATFGESARPRCFIGAR